MSSLASGNPDPGPAPQPAQAAAAAHDSRMPAARTDVDGGTEGDPGTGPAAAAQDLLDTGLRSRGKERRQCQAPGARILYRLGRAALGLSRPSLEGESVAADSGPARPVA